MVSVLLVKPPKKNTDRKEVMARARSFKVASTPRKRAKVFLDRLKQGLCRFKTVESQWVNNQETSSGEGEEKHTVTEGF